MEIIIIIALVLLNGVFAMSEMALVSSRKFKLESAKKKGTSGAKVALELANQPTKFLSTVQIGITLIGILLGIYSGDKLTSDVVALLSQVEPIKPFADSLAVGIIVVFITFLSIVLGELFPKRVGMTFPEPIAIFMAKPMKLLSQITSPFVWLLSKTNDLLSKLFGIQNNSGNSVSEEEIKALVKEGNVGGEILDIEHEIVQRVFELGDRRVNTLFTHRSDIVYFNDTDSWSEIRNKINDEKHSAYPVCSNNDLDQLKGVVLLKDLFQGEQDSTFKLNDFIKKPVYINENTYAYRVLEMFKKEKMHYGIVYDEFGTIMGIVTMDDVVDALVGDVTEIDQSEYNIIPRDNNSWIVDGQYSIIDFTRYFEDEFDVDYQDKFTTVGGLILSLVHQMPEIGDIIPYQGYQFEVVDKDGQRIDKVLFTKMEGK